LLRLLGRQNSLPWLCCGDFNEIVRGSETIGGRNRPEWQMRNFRDVLASVGLSSLPFRGPQFTWRGRRTNRGRVKAWLDRFLINGDWLSLFPNVHTQNVVASASNHLPIFLSRCPREFVASSKRFRFEAMWLTHKGCQRQVKEAWASVKDGPALEQVTHKIKACQDWLAVWEKDSFGSIKRTLQAKMKQL
jgi:hypothetical protein